MVKARRWKEDERRRRMQGEGSTEREGRIKGEGRKEGRKEVRKEEKEEM
jgi:hypothetical protein